MDASELESELEQRRKEGRRNEANPARSRIGLAGFRLHQDQPKLPIRDGASGA